MSGRGWPTRLYAAALRAFPRRHRDAYRVEMIDAFERQLSTHRRSGRLRALWFIVAASVNLVSAGLGERRRHRHLALAATAGVSPVDFRLAWRMLVRYPGLSLVSVFGLAVGMAIAAAAFTIIYAILDPVVPLPDGERVVAIVSLDAATTNSEERVMHDVARWRTLTSLEDLGASVTVGRTLIADGGQPETVMVAEISAAAFRVARIQPTLGRYLLGEDERRGAPDVIVIGHDAWQRRFAGDPAIVGRHIQLGTTAYTIVGVMPEGFGFPVNHRYWIPLRVDPSSYAPRTGPDVTVFARLAPGATLETARAELVPMARRMAVDLPDTHRHLQAQVVPFTYAFSGMAEPGYALALHAMQLAILMLLVVVCVNVAILVYARTATRAGEIAVRSALGASRRRVVTQLFVEALLLASVAAMAGIGLASVALTYLEAALRQFVGTMPFWITFQVSGESALYVVVLALSAAAIVGIVPAIKATGRRVQTGLHGLSAGSGARMQMGRLWTLLIVVQVALTVAMLPASIFHAWHSLRFRTGDLGTATQDFVSTRLVLDRPSDGHVTAAGGEALRRAFATRQAELEQRLEADAAVSAVTYSLANPGEELAAVLEVEGVPPPLDLVDYNIVEGTKQGHLVRFNRVALDFFDAFDVPVQLGRALKPGDGGVFVNRAIVDELFGGANPLGRRVRYVGRSREAPKEYVQLGRWYEVVGVVPDFPAIQTFGSPRVHRLYHAAAPGEIYPPMLSVRVRGGAPSTFASRLREMSAAVDPDLQLREVSSVAEAMKREQGVMRVIGVTITLAMLSVMVLSAAGSYSLMSFTVARRRREIGIRSALGADPVRILAGIFSRAFAQLGAGAAAGMAGAVGLEQLLEGEMLQGQAAVILPIVALVLALAGLLAAIGPARQGLRIDPTEALRAE